MLSSASFDLSQIQSNLDQVLCFEFRTLVTTIYYTDLCCDNKRLIWEAGGEPGDPYTKIRCERFYCTEPNDLLKKIKTVVANLHKAFFFRR